MRCVLALSVAVLAALLAACGKQPADNLTDVLAVDPVRLKALRAQCAADGRATGEDACRDAAKPSGGASFPAGPGWMNTRRWPICRRSRPASRNRPMAWRQPFPPNRRARHE